MRHHWGTENLSKLAREASLGPGTSSRIKGGETYVQLDTIESVAEVFDLAPWQLMVPDMDPSNPPVLVPVSAAERKLYKRFLAFKKVIENGDEDEQFQDTRPGSSPQ